MKSIIKQLYTILLVTVACLTVTGCSDDCLLYTSDAADE